MSVHTAEGEREYLFETDLHPFATIVTATFAADRWSAVFYSWMSLKGFVVGVHGVENVRLFATEVEDGRVQAVFVIVFSNRGAVISWVDNGYTIEEMLMANGVAEGDITSVLARDLS